MAQQPDTTLQNTTPVMPTGNPNEVKTLSQGLALSVR
jgi:hypothetical protein